MKFIAKPLVGLLCAALIAGGYLVLSPLLARPNISADGLTAGTVVKVADGDTITVEVQGENRKVRLIGIDAPESVSPEEERNSEEGERASAYLKDLLPVGARVYLEADKSETDRYGRYLYYVWLDDPAGVEWFSMLNYKIVQDGYAQAKRYPPDTKYAAQLERAQSEAVREGRGVSYLWR